MSKTIIMMCLGIIIINLIAGCTMEESETITIGVFEGTETAYTEMVNSEDFKSAFPDVNVKIQCETFEDHHNRLIVQLTEGQGACEIETVEIEILGRVIATEGLTDLSLPPFNGIAAGKDIVSFGMATATTKDNRLIAFPMDIAPAVLFYRQSIASASGVDLTSLADWTDYINKAQALTIDTNTDGIIDTYALSDGLNPGMILLNGGKGDWFDADDYPYEPESRFKNVLQITQEVKEAGIDAGLSIWSDAWKTGLTNGTIASLFSGSWMGGTLNWICPNLAGDWRVAPLPGNLTASSGGSFLIIPRQIPDEKKTQAWEIVKYLCTNQTPQLIQLRASFAFPVLTTVYNDPVISEPLAFFGGQRIYEVFRDAALNLEKQKVTELDSIAYSIFYKNMESVYAGEKTVDQAYNDAKAELSTYMR